MRQGGRLAGVGAPGERGVQAGAPQSSSPPGQQLTQPNRALAAQRRRWAEVDAEVVLRLAAPA
jgi:hypothetical protein